MKSFYLETFGCTQNKSDSEAVKALLLSNGFKETTEKKAGLILINSCGVKDHTEAKILSRLKKINGKKKTVVFGCLPKISPEKIKEANEHALLLGPKPLEELREAFSLKPGRSYVEASYSPFVKIISISDGCLGNCSYCATKQARGNLKSRGIDEINSEFMQALEKGFKEFWLTSQDTGCYGFDKKTNLIKLLEALLENDGKYRIRIGMMNYNHARKMKKKLIKILSHPNVFQFLHLPLQSGSDRILSLMNRGYKVKDFLFFAKSLRKKLPLLTLSTDIIVGFPAETEKDFRETVKAVKALQPDIVNVSKFSERPGIKALKVFPKVSGPDKKNRSGMLAGLCREISLKRNKLLEHSRQEIFVSEKGKKGFVGRTFNYKHVVIPGDLRGSFAKLKIKKAFPNYLLAHGKLFN